MTRICLLVKSTTAIFNFSIFNLQSMNNEQFIKQI